MSLEPHATMAALRRALVLALAVAAVAPSLGVASASESQEIDRIAARVEERIITASDVIRLLPVYVQIMGADPRRLNTDQGREQIVRDVLDFLIDAEVLRARAVARQLMPSEAEIQEYLASRRNAMQLTQEQFDRALRQEGIEPEDYEEIMRSLLVRMRMIHMEAASSLQISDEQLDREMAARFPDGATDRWATFRLLLLPLTPESTEPEVLAALEATELLMSGTSGNTAALEDYFQSEAGRSSVWRAGAPISVRAGELDPLYQRALADAEPGVIVGPLRTRRGVELLAVEGFERRPVGNVEEVRERVRFELYQSELERHERAYLERVRAESFVDQRLQDYGLILQQLRW